jgi:type IV protein arginine methyltransferase
MDDAGEQLVAAILQRQSVDYIQNLIENGAPVWYQNKTEGTSPLHAAAHIQNPSLVQILIQNGAVWNSGTCSPLSIHSSF